MSATHLGCGCVASRDHEGLLVTVGPCERHRWALQPELEALYQRVLDLRRLDALATQNVERRGQAPDIDVVFIPEDPLTRLRSKP